MAGTDEARGILFLVVGPSGAGKDTLLDIARSRLSGRPDILFPTRIITRSADAGGERHEAATSVAFAARRAAGELALCWHAHGLDYGIPMSIERALAAGRSIVVNVSREVIAEATERFSPVVVLNVTAPAAVLRDRLTARGREDAADVEARLARAALHAPTGDNVIHIVNDGTVEEGSALFLGTIEHCLAVARGN